MLGGGKWIAQNKKLSGAYINFVSKQSVGNISNPTPIPPVSPDIVPDGYIYLMDTSGAYLITSDDKYIIVKEI